eukprot:scaffold101182_cov74-Phaeocystis_antarctica.AAC.2
MRMLRYARTIRHRLEHRVERGVRRRRRHEPHLLVVDWLRLVLRLLRRLVRLGASPLPLDAVGGAAALAQRLRHLADVLLGVELHIEARVREVARVAGDGVHRDRLVEEREALHALLPIGRHPHHTRRCDHQRAARLDRRLSDEDAHGAGVVGSLTLLEHDVCTLRVEWAGREYRGRCSRARALERVRASATACIATVFARRTGAFSGPLRPKPDSVDGGWGFR